MPSRTSARQIAQCERCVEFAGELLALGRRPAGPHGRVEMSMQVLSRSRRPRVWPTITGRVSRFVSVLPAFIDVMHRRFKLGNRHDVVELAEHR